MKRWLKRLGLGFAILALIPVTIWFSGFLLPSKIVIDTEKNLASESLAIYELISEYDGVLAWWTQVGEDIGEGFEIRHLEGPTSGKGMVVGFYSPDGALMETWTYVDAIAPATNEDGEKIPGLVRIEVDFQIFSASRTLELTALDSGTLMNWNEIAIVDEPHWRWLLKLGTSGAIDNRQLVMVSAERVTRPTATP